MIAFSNGQENITNVAIYTRVSTEEQAHEGYSLDNQLERLRAFCKAREWTITGEYIDAGYTGRNTRRPQYQQMLEDIGKWDAMLIIKMDRIHRKVKNALAMFETLEKKGKHFISFTENIDTTTAMGRAMMTITLVFAQLESEQIGERVFSSLVHKAQKTDKFMGHRMPFGYELIEDKIIPISEKLEIVKKVFDLYVNGKINPVEKTKKGYINRVTGNKISDRNANRFINEYKNCGYTLKSLEKELAISKSTVRYYLNNIFYAGYERWCHFFRKINNGFEPIISAELWNQAQKKLRSTCKTHSYDPMLIPDDKPEYWALDKTDRKQIPIIMRAKHNFKF